MTTKISRRNVRRGLITRTALTIFSAMLLLQLPACVEELTPPNNDNETTITFSVGVPRNFTPSTYALSEDDEKAISTVDVLLFKDDKFFSGPHYGIVSGTDVTIRIPSDDGTYSMSVLANCRADLSAQISTLNTSNTKAEVLQSLLVANADKWDATTADGKPNKPIPMWGEADISVSGGTASSPVNVELIRTLARVNIFNDVSAGNFVLTSVRLYNYNVAGRVAPEVGDANIWDSTNKIAKVPSLPVSAGTTTGPIIYDGFGDIAYESDLIGEIYTFEAAKGTDELRSKNTCLVIGGKYDGEATETFYRVDFAEHSEVGEGVQTLSYLDLLRNHSYNVTLTSVSARGMEDPESALEYTSLNIEYSVVEWDDYEITQISSNGVVLGVSQGEFYFDSAYKGAGNGDNILFVKTDYPAGWSATIEDDGSSWLSLINIAGTQTVTTGSSGSSAVKLKFDENTGDAPRSAVIKVKAGNTIYPVSVTQSHLANSYDVFQPESNSYIVAPGGNKIFIPVSRANASPEIGIQLLNSDVFTAGLVWTDNLDGDPANGLGVDSNIKVIDVFGTGAGGHVYVETGNGEGNAVVAIKNVDGDILWSWHIWVTDYEPPTTGTQYETFMDRNLGALSNGYADGNVGGAISTNATVLQQALGLMYQWGRKDPFPGSKFHTNGAEPYIYYGSFTTKSEVIGEAVTHFATDCLSVPKDIIVSVQNPDKLITGSSSDWCSQLNGQDSERWGIFGITYIEKSVYDPCPPGWRIPIQGAYTGGQTSPSSLTDSSYITLSAAGWVWDDTSKGYKVDKVSATNKDYTYPDYAWYPAAGYRGNSYGSLSVVGTNGLYWSGSSAGEISGFHLSFSLSHVNPANIGTATRTRSMLVRCINN